MDNDLKIIYSVWIFAVVSLFITIQLIPLTSAVIIEGTDAGFVTTAPTETPTEVNAVGMDSYARASKFVAPTGAVKVTEIGWYCNKVDYSSNTQVGIYSHDSENDKPNVLLGTSGDFQVGTEIGWKKATGLNIVITEGETYWIAAQVDNVRGVTRTFISANASHKGDYKSSQSALPNPWDASTGSYGYIHPIYAVYETEEPGDTCTCAGDGNNWEIDLSDYCVISDNCDLGIGNITFTGIGNITFNSTITAFSIGDLPDNQRGFLTSNAEVNAG